MVLMEYVNDTIEVAKGISEYGFMAMTTAFYLVTTGVLVVWLGKFFNKTIQNQQEMLKSIIVSLGEQKTEIKQLKEAMTGEVYNQIRIAVKHVFRSIIHEVCITIADTKEGNNLSNRTAVEERIVDRVENFYKSDCADLSAFQYEGKNLAECMNPKWMNKTSDFCITSVFDEQPYHRRLYLPHLKVMFEKFRLELFENLRKM